MSSPDIEKNLSFLDLAESVLEHASAPMTTAEIWREAVRLGLTRRLASEGRTPEATLGARLYVEVKRQPSRVVATGQRPKRFTRAGTANPPESSGTATAPPPTAPRLTEREMHPVLAYFAEQEFSARCQTVFHEKSAKAVKNKNKWLHPDMVGFRLLTEGWKVAPLAIAAREGARAVHVYSFELKLKIDFSTLREYFFQALSNSSWAHEGYLVVWQIEQDPEFREELRRLCESFGLGVIQLRPDAPTDCHVLHLARVRGELDWPMLNRLYDENPDVENFVNEMNDSLKTNKVVATGFDAVPDENKLQAIAEKARLN